MIPTKKLDVSFSFSPKKSTPVGVLLLRDNGEIRFSFHESFLANPLPLSPFKLRVRSGILIPEEQEVFQGLFGVFADSLPDGWGLLLMKRAMAKEKIAFGDLSALDYLAYIGHRSMGALVYEPPQFSLNSTQIPVELASMALNAQNILEGKSEEVIPQLLLAGGSPGGARPKITVGLKKLADREIMVSGPIHFPNGFEEWLIKFKGKEDNEKSGVLEYIYNLTAERAGLKPMPFRLFLGKYGPGKNKLKGEWFGCQRFDRLEGGKRLHLHSLAGIHHGDFRSPTFDYEVLFRTILLLARNDDELEKAYRLMAFNVIFHNRDDHGKNFSFLMNEQGEWVMAPPYDLTYADGPGGEHATSILGEGRRPTLDHMLKLGDKIGMKKSKAKSIIEEVLDAKPFLKDQLRQHSLTRHLAFSL